LAEPSSVNRLRQILADETGTLGIRAHSSQRWPSTREFLEVEVGGYPVKVKRGPRRVKAEHDDAARVARLLRVPVREVARRAEESAHRLFGDVDADPEGGGPSPDGGGMAG
jgi:pyridinium-3,5-bisthiocarboxylic acid mononucleotide nickel chelatase